MGCCKPFASRNENLFSKTKTTPSILLLAKLSQRLLKGRPNRLARPDTLTGVVKLAWPQTVIHKRGDSETSTFRIRHTISRHVGTSENRSFLTSGVSHSAAFSGLSVTRVFGGRVSMTERSYGDTQRPLSLMTAIRPLTRRQQREISRLRMTSRLRA